MLNDTNVESYRQTSIVIVWISVVVFLAKEQYLSVSEYLLEFLSVDTNIFLYQISPSNLSLSTPLTDKLKVQYCSQPIIMKQKCRS